MSNLPRHIFFTEPLFLIPSVQTEVQESGSTRGAYFFRRNQFSSCRPAEPVRLEAVSRTGCPGKPADRSPRVVARFISGNHFSSFLPASTDIQRNGDRACGRLRTFCQGTAFPQSFRPRLLSGKPAALFFEGTTFPYSLWSHGCRWPSPATFPSSSSASSSQQGDNESPAVRKTDASVRRRLPPTS